MFFFLNIFKILRSNKFRFKREEILETRLKRYDKDVLEKTIEADDLHEELEVLKKFYKHVYDDYMRQLPL